MSLIHIFERGGDEAQRFEDAMYDIKEAVSEVCEIYEQMKSQYGERDGYGEGYSNRYGERYSRRSGSMGERRGRR